jgi:hypothetical protein
MIRHTALLKTQFLMQRCLTFDLSIKTIDVRHKNNHSNQNVET